MAAIDLIGATRIYPDGTRAVSSLDLRIADGELLTLVGPSGSGKTTVLRLIAGLEPLDAGSIRIGGHPADGLPPRERDIAMVFQQHSLYPHLDVEQNLAFALKVRHLPDAEIKRRVKAEARAMRLDRLLRRKPRTLSAGHQQGVALARATARGPSAFLLDEPLSQLDAQQRVRMRAELLRLQRGMGATTVYVTNDQTEALALGDRVAVLCEGRLQQVASPEHLYAEPANAFVAGFIGVPPMTLVEGRFERRGDGWVLWIGDAAVGLPGQPVVAMGPSGHVVVGVRPQHLVMEPGLARFPRQRWASAPVQRVERLGHATLVAVDVGASAPRMSGCEPEPLIAQLPPERAVAVGDRLRFAVDVRGLRFFDAITGQALPPS